MTDKQITIDEIDVSGCPHYIHKDGSCSSHDCECIKCVHNECFYKDYKAKEQECEKFKEENKLAKEIITKAVVDFSIEYGTKQYRRLLNGAKLLGIEVQDDR